MSFKNFVYTIEEVVPLLTGGGFFMYGILKNDVSSSIVGGVIFLAALNRDYTKEIRRDINNLNDRISGLENKLDEKE